jgi:hypothetical protein
VSSDDADPWSLTDAYQDKIDIYGSPAKFERTFARAPTEIGYLYAARWCHDEVCNGGFHQFFSNSTGVLAPEALAAFNAMKLKRAAKLLEKAMAFFGKKYPRDAATRQRKLDRLTGEGPEDWDPFYRLSLQYYEVTAAYENASMDYAKAYAEKLDAKPPPVAKRKRASASRAPLSGTARRR